MGLYLLNIFYQCFCHCYGFVRYFGTADYAGNFIYTIRCQNFAYTGYCAVIDNGFRNLEVSVCISCNLGRMSNYQGLG